MIAHELYFSIVYKFEPDWFFATIPIIPLGIGKRTLVSTFTVPFVVFSSETITNSTKKKRFSRDLLYNWEYITLKRCKFIRKVIWNFHARFCSFGFFDVVLTFFRFIFLIETIHFKEWLSHYFRIISEKRQTDAWLIGSKPMANKSV